MHPFDAICMVVRCLLAVLGGVYLLKFVAVLGMAVHYWSVYGAD